MTDIEFGNYLQHEIVSPPDAILTTEILDCFNIQPLVGGQQSEDKIGLTYPSTPKLDDQIMRIKALVHKALITPQFFNQEGIQPWQ